MSEWTGQISYWEEDHYDLLLDEVEVGSEMDDMEDRLVVLDGEK